MVEARTFSPLYYDKVELDDVLDVTEVATDPDGTRAYATVWAATDWDLDPERAPMKGEPFTHLTRRYGGGHTFAKLPRGLRVTGTWGFGTVVPPVVEEATRQLAAAIVSDRSGSDLVTVQVGDIREEYGGGRSASAPAVEAAEADIRAQLRPVIRRRLFS